MGWRERERDTQRNIIGLIKVEGGVRRADTLMSDDYKKRRS
jgi:hypothetical protein